MRTSTTENTLKGVFQFQNLIQDRSCSGKTNIILSDHRTMTFILKLNSCASRRTHPARSGGRTAGSRSAAWWCWGRGRRPRCRTPRAGSREQAPGRSSPPSTPGDPASDRPARTLGGALPSCLHRNHTAEGCGSDALPVSLLLWKTQSHSLRVSAVVTEAKIECGAWVSY